MTAQQPLGDIATGLAKEFDSPPEEIERDVMGFAAEILRRKMRVEVAPETASELHSPPS